MNDNQNSNENVACAQATFDTPNELKEKLIRTAQNIQMLPDVAVQAIAIAEDPDARIKQLVDVIAQDVKLTTDILQLSNCSLFGATEPTLCLQKAIMRLGFRLTKSLILATSISSMMKQMPWRETRIRDMLCEHGLLTAIFGSQLNQLFGLGMQGEEFTGGLVHDVGRTLLAISMPDEFSQFDPMDFCESESMLDREIDVLGTTHADVGAWFLQRNHLPDELITVALYHHTPQKTTRFNRLVALTSLADELANYCHRDKEAEVFDVQENSNLELLEFLGVEAARQKCESAFAEMLEIAKESLRQMLSFN